MFHASGIARARYLPYRIRIPRVRYSARQVPVKGGYRIETPRVRYSARQVPAPGGYRIDIPRIRYCAR